MKRPTIKEALEWTTSTAICVAGILVWNVVGQRHAEVEKRGDPVSRLSGVTLDISQFSNVMGSGSATLVEFSDFECPFCGSYARNVLPSLVRAITYLTHVQR